MELRDGLYVEMRLTFRRNNLFENGPEDLGCD